MDTGILINDLELGYAPMSAYFFSRLIRDKEFHLNVEKSHLYIIAQRNAITFNNFRFSTNKVLQFELKQDSNSEIIFCELPVFQKHIATDLNQGVDIKFQNRNITKENKPTPPFNGTQGIIFQEVNIKTNGRKNLIWFSPEKLLQNYWKGHIQLSIEGDFKKMLNYQVHYVGKSTEQNICQRLSRHSTFEEILINEEPLTYGNIPSDEIVILLFRIKDNSTIVSWGADSPTSEAVDYLTSYVLPDDKTVSLDAEKALIKHLQPAYNRITYKSYPNSDDLVNKDKHSVILYGIADPITLVYQSGQVKGDKWFDERDYIRVEQKNN